MIRGWLGWARQRLLLGLLRALGARGPVMRRLQGLRRALEVRVLPGVHDPEPLPGLGFGRLWRAAAFARGERVLELGTGAGGWALLAAEAGAEVTATDLPSVPLEPVREAAEAAGLALRLVHGDLFAAVPGEHFDAVCFNPPFHDGKPRAGEEAWVGGSVVRRFLAELPNALRPSGRAYVVLPRWEQADYAAELAPWRVRVCAGLWMPLLGRVELLELRSGGTGEVPLSDSASAWRRLGELCEIRSCELVTLDGRLDSERLAAAVAWLPKQHPLLAARATPDGWRLNSQPIGFRVEEVDYPDQQAVIDRTWHDGEGVDVTLLRGPHHDWLRMRVPHDRTDARSGAQVMEDLAGAYGALAAGRTPELRPDGAPWAPRRLLPLRAADVWRGLRRLAADLDSPASFALPPEAPRGPARVRVVVAPADTLPVLKQRAAELGTTVHSLLVEATTRTFGVHRVLDLMTLRPLAAEPVDARSDVLVVPWVMGLPPDSTGVARRAAVSVRVASMKEGGVRGELMRLALYSRLARFASPGPAVRLATRWLIKADVIVTNPGPVHTPLQAFGDVPVADFVNYPSLVPPARAGIVFTSFRGRLRLLALWDSAAYPQGIEAQVAQTLATARGDEESDGPAPPA